MLKGEDREQGVISGGLVEEGGGCSCVPVNVLSFQILICLPFLYVGETLVTIKKITYLLTQVYRVTKTL